MRRTTAIAGFPAAIVLQYAIPVLFRVRSSPYVPGPQGQAKTLKKRHDDATAVQASAAFVALYARSKKLIDGSLQPDVHTAKRALLTSPILNGERSVKSRPSRLLSLRLQRSLFLTSSGRAWCASAVSTAFVAKRDAERRRYPTG